MSVSLFCILLCAAAGAGSFVDRAVFTDPSTGFSTVGSVWIRYGVLALVTVVIWLCSRRVPGGALPRRRAGGRLLAGAFFLQALSFIAGGALLLAGSILQVLQAAALADGLAGQPGFDVARTVLGLLYMVGGLWSLSCSGGSAAGGALPPASLPLGIGATVAFFLLCVKRFLVSPTSIQRVVPTLDILAAIAAMLFCCTLLRGLYLPQQDKTGQRAFLWGIMAFLFCFCIVAAKLLCQFTFGELSLASGEDLPLLGAGLCGAVVALRAARETPPARPPQ